MLKLGVSLNLPVMELLQALQQFQHKSPKPAPAPKAKQQELRETAIQAPQQPGLVHPRPPGPGDPDEVAPPPPSQPPTAEDGKQMQAMTHPSYHANPSANQNMTWDSDIGDLQPGPTDYASIRRWEPTSSSRQWVLPEETSLIQSLKIQRFKWTPLPPKVPSQHDAGLADRAVQALNIARAAPRPEDTETQLPPSAPPPQGLPPTAPPLKSVQAKDSEDGRGGAWAPPVPPAAPPPPPAVAGGPLAGAAGPPPGLVASGPNSSRGGTGNGGATTSPATGADGKECKQQ